MQRINAMKQLSLIFTDGNFTARWSNIKDAYDLIGESVSENKMCADLLLSGVFRAIKQTATEEDALLIEGIFNRHLSRLFNTNEPTH